MAKAARESIVLEVESRNELGSTACRRMRREGRVPANVYGLNRPPFKVSVSPRRIEEVLRLGSGKNTVFQLSLAGDDRTREAMIKDLQRDPVTELPLHIDFIRVDPTKTVQISVPVHLEGTPLGVKLESGIVDFIHRDVHVECLPTAIPDHLSVDVSELHINQHVSIGDLETFAGVEILDDPEQVIAVVVAPKVEEEAAAEEEEAEAAEGAEPEVAAKGKEAEPAAGESGAGTKKD